MARDALAAKGVRAAERLRAAETIEADGTSVNVSHPGWDKCEWTIRRGRILTGLPPPLEDARAIGVAVRLSKLSRSVATVVDRIQICSCPQQPEQNGMFVPVGGVH